ncbi:MAG TPA: TolC family protein [Chryseolinea sp.]|nr:TolC family protein [Chryseolinea sp.]
MKFLVAAILAISTCHVFSQVNPLSVDKVVEEALKNNESIKAANFELESQKQLKKTSFDLPKTEVMLMYGQYNSYAKNDNNITVSQSIPFSAFGSQRALNRALSTSHEMSKAVTENEIVYQVKQTYYQLAFTLARHNLLLRQDSIYEGFLKSATLRYQTGETNLLEQATAEAQRNEIKNQLRQNEGEIVQLQSQLKIIANSPSLPDVALADLSALSFENLLDTIGYKTNPSLTFMHQQIEVAQNQKKLQSSKVAPDILVGFFSQTLIGGPSNESGSIATSSDRFTGFQVGVSLPLWFVPHHARIRSAEFTRQATESKYRYYQTSLQGQVRRAIQQLTIHKNSLDYYSTSALLNSDLILKQSQTAYKEGEIGYAEYLLGIRNAINIREGYLKTLNDYNQSVIYIEYLTGKK